MHNFIIHSDGFMEKVKKKQFGTNGLERKSKLKLTIGAVLQATDSTQSDLEFEVRGLSHVIKHNYC